MCQHKIKSHFLNISYNSFRRLFFIQCNGIVPISTMLVSCVESPTLTWVSMLLLLAMHGAGWSNSFTLKSMWIHTALIVAWMLLEDCFIWSGTLILCYLSPAAAFH